MCGNKKIDCRLTATGRSSSNTTISRLGDSARLVVTVAVIVVKSKRGRSPRRTLLLMLPLRSSTYTMITTPTTKSTSLALAMPAITTTKPAPRATLRSFDSVRNSAVTRHRFRILSPSPLRLSWLARVVKRQPFASADFRIVFASRAQHSPSRTRGVQTYCA